ncbi:MAG: exosortase [Deltaproteobacteria bacterium]|nr:exosortase [Deltaproteobacteria bacterium]
MRQTLSVLSSLTFSVFYLVICIGLFYSSHAYMIKGWNKDDYTYCYLIPFIILYLVWEQRRKLAALPSIPSWTGLVPICFGIALFWLGELGGEYYTLYLSSWLVVIGLCWLHLGRQKLKVIAFPFFLILTMFPPPNFVYANVSLKLKLISSQLGVYMMRLYGMSAFREGNVIDLGFTQLQVVDACSGLRYLIPLIVLGVLLAYFFKAAWWKKVVLVVSTIPISIVVNSVRIASVGILYQFWGQAVAEGFFHDFSGWFIFMSSFLILLLEMKVLCFRFYVLRKREEKEMGVLKSVQSSKFKVESHRRASDTEKDNHPHPQITQIGAEDRRQKSEDRRQREFKIQNSQLSISFLLLNLLWR